MNKFITNTLTITMFLSSVACTTQRHPEEDLRARTQLTADIMQRYQIDGHWWKIYNDNQLNQLIELAMRNNIDLAKTAININKALYQANLLGEDLVPSFSAGTTNSVTKNLSDGGHSTRSSSGNIGVSYELDLWRKLADSVSAQQWEFVATTQDRETTRLALINSIVDSYYNLTYLHYAITITEQSIKHYKEIDELISYKYQYGKVDSLDPAQTKQAILNANNTLYGYQNQQKIAEQTLRNLLNLKPSEPLLINYPDLLTLPLPDVDLNVPLSVIANRPDLKAIEYRLQRSFLNLSAVQKSWYPTITLGGTIQSSSQKIRKTFELPMASGNVAINLPFLQWNKIRWNIKISKAEYEDMQLELEKGITTALNEISTYYFNYTKTKDTLANIQQKYNYDVQISQYYNIRYEQGAGELKDWIDALNTVTASRISLISSRYQLIQYENLIYKAIAGRYIATTNNTTTK